MQVQELMTHPVATCHVNDTLSTVAQKMWDRDCGVLPVVNDDGQVTGMVTDRDICMAAYTQGRSLDQILVNSAMAHHVIALRADQRIGEAEELMARHQVRRLPVVDRDGHPIGILSLNDLALESVRPRSEIKHAATKIAHTLAAICRPRAAAQKAA